MGLLGPSSGAQVLPIMWRVHLTLYCYGPQFPAATLETSPALPSFHSRALETVRGRQEISAVGRPSPPPNSCFHGR